MDVADLATSGVMAAVLVFFDLPFVFIVGGIAASGWRLARTCRAACNQGAIDAVLLAPDLNAALIGDERNEDIMTKLRVIERNEEPTGQTTDRLRYLIALQRKVLWLSAWMIHNANHLRPSRDGLKVGGHQASSAS